MNDISASKTVALASVLASRGAHPRRVLVVGCGDGQEAKVLAEFFAAEVIGIDLLDRTSEEKAKALPARLEKMDAHDLAFPGNSFDLVYSFHALEHVSRPASVLAEMNRVLCPGGLFCIGTPNKARLIGYIGSPASSTKKIRWNFNDWRMRARGKWSNEMGAHAGFTRDELRQLCIVYFSCADDITEDYYATLYSRHKFILSTLERMSSLREALLPCVYFAGRKASGDSK